MQSSNNNKLTSDVSLFGLCYFGDGATIAKLPLFNILVSSAYLPAVCKEIVNCSEQMEQAGRKKDASYLALLFYKYIEETGTKNCNLLIFDGAANVQKAGQDIGWKYLRISTIHGIKHVASLLFKDCASIVVIEIIIKYCKVLYTYFGSGSRHASYAIFFAIAKHNNGGKKIGLIKVVDTQMGYHFIALLQLLQLKASIEQTIVSNSFLHLKLKGAKELVAVLKQDTFLNMVVTILKALFLVL